MEAYEMLLKGSYFFKKGYEGIIKSLAYFQKAVDLDSEYAEAHAFVGETYLHHAGFNLMSASDAYSSTRTAAQKAINLNEYEPRAHKVLSYIHLFYDWDWDASRDEYNKALQYGLSEQNEFITYYYIFLNNDNDRAIHISEQMLETDPLLADSHWQLGICYYFSRRFKDALVSFHNALELDPNFSDGHHWKGLVLGYLGEFEEAISSLEKSLKITTGEGLANLDLLAVKIQMGNKDEALQKIQSMKYIDSMDVARLYTLLGMHDEAFYWLEKGYRERSVMMVTLKHWWLWDPIRDDPCSLKFTKE